ncbi:DsrE/DsrF/TusD sulfur relay family protein [Aurantivibrio plasticivorans]
MIYAINIFCEPTTPASSIAARFTKQVISEGHGVYRLFFYGDGVSNLLQRENPLASIWSELITQHNIDAVACVSSLNARHPGADSAQPETLIPNISVSGLGQYIDSLLQADRVINFGG